MLDPSTKCRDQVKQLSNAAFQMVFGWPCKSSKLCWQFPRLFDNYFGPTHLLSFPLPCWSSLHIVGYLWVIRQTLAKLWQGRVRASAMCSWHWFFTFFEHVLANLQWKPIQTEFPCKFLRKTQWAQIRTAFLFRAVASCFRSAHARRPLWEPLDMSTVTCFDVTVCFCWSHFWNRFFWKMMPGETPNPMTSQVWEALVGIETWNAIGKTYTTNIKLIPLDL